jgi:hypothetical protein
MHFCWQLRHHPINDTEPVGTWGVYSAGPVRSLARDTTGSIVSRSKGPQPAVSDSDLRRRQSNSDFLLNWQPAGAVKRLGRVGKMGVLG